MALSPAQLAVELRVVGQEDFFSASLPVAQQSVITRLLATTQLLVSNYAAAAPEHIRDEAIIRVAGFLYDSPAETTRGQNPLRASGAQALLSPWHSVRLLGRRGLRPHLSALLAFRWTPERHPRRFVHS